MIIEGKQTHKGCAPEIRKLKTKHPLMSNSEIARKVGCTPDNVGQVLSRFLGTRTVKNHSAALEELRANQLNTADIYDTVKFRFLASLDDAKIRKASAVQAVTAAAILHDKAALLRGQPTGINVTVLMDVVEAMRNRE